MNETARKPRVAGFALFTLFLTVVFVALGLWQLQRRAAKHQLIAALTERLAAAPVALPPSSQWSTLTPERDEFRRVTFAATYESRLDAMVYSSGSAIRSDISGPGTWAFLPARLPGGDIVAVNAGFVPNTQQDRAVQDRAVARLVTNKPAMLTGYIRFPEAASVLMPDAEHSKRLWFTRDHLEMSRTLGWGTVAPFYVDLERPVPENGIPRPGPLDVHLKDDHLQYAITWFALAGAVLIAFVVWARGRRPSSIVP